MSLIEFLSWLDSLLGLRVDRHRWKVQYDEMMFLLSCIFCWQYLKHLTVYMFFMQNRRVIILDQ